MNKHNFILVLAVVVVILNSVAISEVNDKLYIRYDFEGTTHNWSNAKDDGWGSTWWGITGQTYSTDYSYHGFYSLKCTADFNSGTTDGGYVFIKNPNLPDNYLFDYCPTKVYVYMPSGGPTDFQARIHIQNSNWSSTVGSWVTLQPGQWVEVSFTPTDTNVPYKRFGVQIQDTSPSTSWSGYIYIDAASWIQYDFENSDQGWVNSSSWGDSDAGITSQVPSTDYYFTGSYSLKATCNFNSTSYKGAVYRESTARTPPANTPISVRVLMPSGGPTGYTAKIFIQNNGWTRSDSGAVTLTPGSWTTITWAPTDTSTPYQRVGVQVTWNGSDSYTGNIYFDSMCWGDIITPGAITTLSALTGNNEGEIRLSWIAVGDDGYQPYETSFEGYYLIKYTSSTNIFYDDHETDNDLADWTHIGNNAWQESSGKACPLGNNNIGFVIAPFDCSNNGILEVNMNPDPWNGRLCGIVFRFIDQNNFYFISVHDADGQEGNGVIYFCVNTRDYNNAYDSWTGTLPRGYFTLKVEIDGANYHVYTDSGTGYIFRKTFTHSANTYGKVGYANNAGWGVLVYYDWIRWTDFEINWNNAYQITFSSIILQGRQESYILQGLQPGVTYYIRMWTCDDNGNWSSISNGATAWAQVDIIPPEAITTLSALTGNNEGEIKLTWISPGDDGWVGDIVGGKYRIRYSTYVTDAPDFWTTGSWTDYQNKYEIEWTTNTSPLANQTRLLTGLRSGVTYYIRIWTADEIPNWSNISNGATIYLNHPPPPLTVKVIERDLALEIVWSSSSVSDFGGYHIYKASTSFSYTYPENTVAYWRFEEGSGNIAYDFKGVWNGTLSNTGMWTSQGMFGGACNFNLSGTGDYINVGDIDLNQITIEAWINVNSYDSGLWDHIVAKKWDPNQSPWEVYNLRLNDTDPRRASMVVAVNNTQYIVDTTTYIYTNRWYHLAGTYDGETIRIFVNGLENNSNTSPSGNIGSQNNIPTYIGASYYSAHWFHGIIDEVRISNIARNNFLIGTITNQATTTWTDVYLEYGNTYYYAVAAYDKDKLENGNVVCVSGVCRYVPPAAVTNLSALTGDNEGEIKLTWTSPGDDGWVGDIVGGKYRIRYSTYVTDAPDFWTTGSWTDYQNKYEIEWTTNTSPYASQSKLLTGLRSGVTYYIRIWTADEVPNWSNISNAATAWAQVAVTPPPPPTAEIAGMLCYGEPTDFAPFSIKSRKLSSAATYWFEEETTNAIVQHEPRWVRLIRHPTQERRVLAFSGKDAANTVAICVSTWTAEYGWSSSTFTLASNLDYTVCQWRCFDIAYEQQNGRCLVVYSTGTNVLAYRIFDGTSWSQQQPVPHPPVPENRIYWVKLAAKPNSNEIAMMFLFHITEDNRIDGYASIWDGTQWSTHTQIGGVGVSIGGTQERESMDIAYESLSGHTVFFYGKNNLTLNAKKWTGTEWSQEYSSPTSQTPIYVVAKSIPNSNNIIVADQRTNIEIYTGLWTGEYFTERTLHTSNIANFTHPFDVEVEYYQNHSSHCVLVYALQTSQGIVAKHSEDGLNWTTIESPILATSGNQYNSVYLHRILNSQYMWLITNENSNKLAGIRWDILNSSWSSKIEFENSLSYGDSNDYYSTPYSFSPWAYLEVDTTPPAAVTLYAETGPYPESVRLYWLAPGDDGDEKSLPIGSQYKIQIATFSSTTWDKSLAQITISTSGVTPGTQVEYIITGLAENVTFYFRLWTADEIPNWSDPSNIASAKARVDYSSGTLISVPSTCMVVYSEGSNGVKYRTLTPGTTTWSDEQPVPPINSGTIYWVKIVACPIRDEKAMITLDGNGNLRVSTYSDAGGWANSYFHLGTFSGSNTPATRRWFDICYSQQSGLLMVVYSTGTNVLAYRTFDGTSWSEQGSVGNLISGNDAYPAWVSISPKPNSDEILLAFTGNADRKCYGSVWDGSSWGNHIVVWNGDVNNDSDRCSVAVSYQWSNGVGVVIHANTSSQIVARQWNGTSWGDSVAASAGTVPQFLVLKPNPNTNEIMVFYGNQNANTFAIKWTGSSWGSYTQIDNQGGGVHAYPISGEAEIAEGHSGHWISLSNQANVIGENGGLRSDHYDGNSWSIVQKPVHNTGSLGGFKSVMTTSLPNCNTFYALAVHGNSLYSLCWITESSTWTQLVELENNLNAADPNPYISFWMTPNSELIEMVYKVVPDSVPPAAVNDLKVSLGYIDGQEVFFATWTAPGDNENEFILHEPSKFRIQYSTNPDTLWHYNSAQVEIPISIWGIPPGVEVSTIIVPSQPIQEGVTYYFYLWTADETPNWSDKSNEAKCYIPKTLVHIAYHESTSPANPKYRKWGDNETLSWEYSLPAIPNVQTPGSQSFYKMACSPTRNEAILVFVSSVTDSSLYCRIFVYRFDGSTWSVVASEEVAQLFNSGYLDIAYEQKSGRGILAYKKGNAAGASAILYYRIWDGNQWSSEQQAGSVNEGFINYVKLYPKPETDEIIAVVVSGSVPRCVYTFVWDGNSWQSGVRIVNCATAATYQPFDAAYEGRLKKFVLLVSSSSGAGNARYVVWDSTGWTQEQPIVFPYLTSYPCWIKAAAKPNSDEIVFVANSTSGVISAMVWNGTTWGSSNLLTSNSGILNQHSRPFDVAYEQNSGYAVVVYGDANYIGTPRYVRYHTSSGWSSPSSANSVGSTLIRWISLQPIKNTNQILMLCSDSETTPNLNFQRWDGASWKNLTEIETETSSRESFVMRLREDLYYIKDTTAPAAVTDLSGDVLAEGTVKLNWSTPGDDNWSGVLPCGSRYKIVYSTAEPTDSELTWPATYSILIATYGVSSPQKQFFVISGLPYETTWYFRLRTRDEAGNWSELSNACTLYVVVRPAAITSLSALPSRWGRCIELSWIAPGDDGWMGDIVGGKYRIRYSTYVLPSADFWDTGSWSDFQNKFEIEWSTNTSPYSAQRRRLTGLLPGVTYYIRIWTRDENPDNWSLISNAATSWAQWVIVGIDVKGYQELSWATTYNFDWLQTNTSSIAAYGLVIENTGNVYEDYGVRINTTSMRDDYNTTWTIDDSSSVWYDRFVLEGVFYNLRPATTDYGTNYSENDDVITSLTIWALEDSKYHPPATSNQPEDSKGVRVIPFDDTKPAENEDEETIDQRKFWFRIMTPLATSTTDIQTIPVEFKAKENTSIGPPP